ncbi:acetamidase/formamidase family protein [Rhizobium jaguaris]|uniref:Amidase n=1 Tax=Rhizobium jaguaris TaxID=1312183 RepID=A0A387FS63_9HYPH|nr:acetamidase/formamidase family protein [Rhizobium jaguaris]AYG60255.1 amidase [Rhizobium jaguaris]
MDHHLPASSANCAWGYFDPKRAPALTVDSGDTVVIDTVSGGPDVLPKDDFFIPPELLDVHKNSVQEMPGHILTGPVAIRGAKPGQVLEVRIKDVKLRQNWGYNVIRPLAGTLPYDFETARLLNIPLDAEANVAHLPWGLKLPLAPFFGVMGVAPPPNWGRISSIMPRAHAGNIDNKELVAGTTLYLPIFNEGALFSCGDGHGAQGDGEVCITAIETALRGTFQFIVRNDLSFTYPRAETPTHYITMGMDPDLDQCSVMALRDMIVLLGEKAGLSREDAYTLCSLAGDLHVTQAVNGNKGVHMMMAKNLLREI